MSHPAPVAPALLAGILSALTIALLAHGCTSDKLGPVNDDAAVAMDAAVFPDATPTHPDATIMGRDAEIVVFHDAGGPIACTETCDCPQGQGCVNGTCRILGAAVYCCDKPGCPAGQACLSTNDRPQTCVVPDAGVDGGPASCDRPDASPAEGRDGGEGSIGSFCTGDFDCDQTLGYTCWQRFQPPYVWGYCTLVGCVGGCPAGSMCIQFNIPPPNGPVTGCMQTCNVDHDCRTDAYCFFIANGGFSICLPNCRDDILDCSPRDGTQYCDHLTGECATNMCHAQSGTGDPCIDDQDCQAGHVCMTEAGWGFPGGMCTRVCSGLPEATNCQSGETCQSFAGVGLCFKDCVAGACPDRANAICAQLDPSWTQPSCIAQ